MMRRHFSASTLRLLLSLLFLALAIPGGILIWQTRLQMRWEALHQYRTLSEELAARVDGELQRLITVEEARPQSDYLFLVVAGNTGKSGLLQTSPLAQLPDTGQFPGLVGYFQVGADGRFSTPLLPDASQNQTAYGIDAQQLQQRRAVRDRMLQVLIRNELVSVQLADTLEESKALAGPPNAANDGMAQKGQKLEKYSPQALFDQLGKTNELPRQATNALGRVDQLRLNRDYAAQDKKDQSPELEFNRQVKGDSRAIRREQSAVPEQQSAEPVQVAALPKTLQSENTAQNLTSRVRFFESEVAPFEFQLLGSGEAILFRTVWGDDKRSIQGLLIDPDTLIEQVIARAFQESHLSQMSELVIAWRQDVLAVLGGSATSSKTRQATEVQGELLYQTHLSAPWNQLHLIWSSRELPAGTGAAIVQWAGAVLLLVLVGGFITLYRLGLRQLQLARQQQDFVSAVSHELKTPLTSIRMYAEMLCAGWADESRKQEYYGFIHDESERLSRLIADVLQLARLERQNQALQLKWMPVGALMEEQQRRLMAQIERAGFVVEYQLHPDCAALGLRVDSDAFGQIMINLVDNALKFANRGAQKRLEIAVVGVGNRARISVRDFGPGVPKAQRQKIFQLFYRSGDELTREALGTGIGLALVQQYAQAMQGTVEVINREPGAEFVLYLPWHDGD